MCIVPTFIWLQRGPAWEKQQVPCRKCWQCRKNRVSDYVGRCLAEASLSDWSMALCLTYRDRDDLADKILHPLHFQQAVRSLRRRGHVLRYIACGEYGSLKGRAHFHTILFGKGDPPDVALKQNTHVEWWPHGYIYRDGGADERSIRYVCKYLLKEQVSQSWFTISKKPHLGALWFEEKAQRDAALGLMPTGFRYMPPGGRPGMAYSMTGATRREYLRTLIRELAQPWRKDQLSEWAALSLDKLAKWEHAQQCGYVPNDDFDAAFLAELDQRRGWANAEELDAIRKALDNTSSGWVTKNPNGKWVSHVEET